MALILTDILNSNLTSSSDPLRLRLEKKELFFRIHPIPSFISASYFAILCFSRVSPSHLFTYLIPCTQVTSDASKARLCYGTMGALFSKVFSKLFSKQEMRILMVGLDAAGKTTSKSGFLRRRYPSCQPCVRAYFIVLCSQSCTN
jgi:hypothetical protein